jgi:hypothetical protein
MRQTEAALERLVEEGFIEEELSAASRSSVSRLNPVRLKDAKRFLDAADSKSLRRVGFKKSN